MGWTNATTPNEASTTEPKVAGSGEEALPPAQTKTDPSLQRCVRPTTGLQRCVRPPSAVSSATTRAIGSEAKEASASGGAGDSSKKSTGSRGAAATVGFRPPQIWLHQQVLPPAALHALPPPPLSAGSGPPAFNPELWAAQSKSLNVPDEQMGDEGVRRWVADWGSRLLQCAQSGVPKHLTAEGLPPLLECVDFSRNRLTDDGVEVLMDFLRTKQVRTRRLKLFGNKQVRAVRGLEALLRDPTCGLATGALQELHLTHCSLDRAALRTILIAVQECWPEIGKGPSRKTPPVWLRVEKNEISEFAKLCEEHREAGLKICLAEVKLGCKLHVCKALGGSADIHIFKGTEQDVR